MGVLSPSPLAAGAHRAHRSAHAVTTPAQAPLLRHDGPSAPPRLRLQEAEDYSGKADRAAQEAHLEEYKKLKQDKGENDPIYFMDATHPQHNPALAYGWIKRGEERNIPSNTGRGRLNINGVIDAQTLEPIVRFDDTINAASTIALFQQIERANPQAERISLICDNARYYRSKDVRAFLQTSKIELVFLPPYAPNLNLIERFWKFFKKQVLYNRYYETFEKFKQACEAFFANAHRYVTQLRALFTDNFQIIGH